MTARAYDKVKAPRTELISVHFLNAFRPPPLGFACRRRERPCGPSRMRPCGLTAAQHPVSRFARLASTSLPGRAAGLRSGLFCKMQNDPAAPSVFRVRSRRLPARLGKPTVKTHTHECGSISSGWPPNQPASRIAKLFGEDGTSGGVVPTFEAMHFVSDAPGKLLRPASRRLTPSLTQADSVNQTFGHATTLTWWSVKHLEIPTWLTIKRTPMRLSNFSS